MTYQPILRNQQISFKIQRNPDCCCPVSACLFRVIYWFWRSTADSLSVRSRPGCVTAETRTDPETPGSSVKPRKPQQTSGIDCVVVYLINMSAPVCFLRWRFVFYLSVFSAGLVSLINVSISPQHHVVKYWDALKSK